MSLDALRAGVGARLAVRDLPASSSTRSSARGTAINVGALVGHTPVRLYVMGEEATEREATDDEIARHARIVAEALRAGALGFATSKSPTHVGYAGRPVPSRAASLEEIETLAGCLGEVGHGVMQATHRPRALPRRARAPSSARTGRPVTLDGAARRHARTRRPPRRPRAARPQLQAEGVRGRSRRSSCRPLSFEFQLKAPFPFESMSLFQPVSAGRLARARSASTPTPTFRARVPRAHATRGLLGGRFARHG